MFDDRIDQTIFGIIYFLLLLYPTIIFYRLVLSPLAKFPGSKIAAATGWYEFYWDFFRHGNYIFEIERMHKQYGPIIRINPNELSISDPTYYDELYVTGRKRRTDNYHSFAQGIDFEGSHFLTVTHDLHRRRRKPLEPFFSRMGIIRFQPSINALIIKLNNRIEKATNLGPFRLDYAFSALAGDVITQVCCGEPGELLDHPTFGADWIELIHTFVLSLPVAFGFPWLVRLASFIPESVLRSLYPSMENAVNFKRIARSHIIAAKRELSTESNNSEVTTQTSLFRELFRSDLSESELSEERLVKEAQVLLGAGTASTARTLSFIAYYILSMPSVRTRIEDELRDIMVGFPNEMPSLVQLESLEYMEAVIKEGLRLSYGVMHRLPRCSPDVKLVYKGWSIPQNVPVGMSAYLMHTDPQVYEKPFDFNPDRWLGEVHPLAERYLVPFSRGSRQCLGRNLAKAEILLAIAMLFRPNGPRMELFETDESDAKHVHDYMIPLPKLDTKGIRVLVRNRDE